MRGKTVTRSPRKVLGRVRRSFQLERYDVFTRPVPLEREFVAPHGYLFRWGTVEDIEGADPYHTELDELERRQGIARVGLGHGLVVGTHDREVVFTMWVNPRNLNVPGLIKRRLSPNQWFIYKAFTSPDHRGQGLYEAGMRFVLDDMLGQGLRELVGYAHTKKRVSRKGLARLSFESVGAVYSLQLPGVRKSFVSRELAAAFPDRKRKGRRRRPSLRRAS